MVWECFGTLAVGSARWAGVGPIPGRDQDGIAGGAARHTRWPEIGSRQPLQARERPAHAKSAKPNAVRAFLSGMVCIRGRCRGLTQEAIRVSLEAARGFQRSEGAWRPWRLQFRRTGTCLVRIA